MTTQYNWDSYHATYEDICTTLEKLKSTATLSLLEMIDILSRLVPAIGETIEKDEAFLHARRRLSLVETLNGDEPQRRHAAEWLNAEGIQVFEEAKEKLLEVKKAVETYHRSSSSETTMVISALHLQLSKEKEAIEKFVMKRTKVVDYACNIPTVVLVGLASLNVDVDLQLWANIALVLKDDNNLLQNTKSQGQRGGDAQDGGDGVNGKDSAYDEDSFRYNIQQCMEKGLLLEENGAEMVGKEVLEAEAEKSSLKPAKRIEKEKEYASHSSNLMDSERSEIDDSEDAPVEILPKEVRLAEDGVMEIQRGVDPALVDLLVDQDDETEEEAAIRTKALLRRQTQEREASAALTALKQGDYQVQVHIIEARDLKGENLSGTSDPYCQVDILGMSRKTATKYDTLGCVFDEILFFNFPNIGRHELQEASINISVYDKERILKDNLIGIYQLDCLSVYTQPDHELYRQWIAVHDNLNEKDRGIQGFLLISVVVLGPGDSLRVHDREAEMELELTEATGEKADDSPSTTSPLVLVPPTIELKLQFLVLDDSDEEIETAEDLETGMREQLEVEETQQQIVAASPRWYNLYGPPLHGTNSKRKKLVSRHAELGSTYRGRVLLSMTSLLVSFCGLCWVSKATLGPSPPAVLREPAKITPKFTEANLDIVALGVRHLKALSTMGIRRPHIEFELWKQTESDKPKGGFMSKNANFLDRIVARVKLPVDIFFMYRGSNDETPVEPYVSRGDRCWIWITV
eukprot:jgi/Phyca11/15292/fgenesh1_pg.PHYCAscaffold_12_\